jgi:hypothetical protein
MKLQNIMDDMVLIHDSYPDVRLFHSLLACKCFRTFNSTLEIIKFQAGTNIRQLRILGPSFLSALAKLQTATVGFVMSVRPHGTRLLLNGFS